MAHKSAFAALILSCLAACSKTTTPNTPSTPAMSFAGTWTGDLVLQTTTTTRMTWTLSQSGSTVTGPAIVGLPTGVVLLNGTLNGTAAAATLTYAISVQPGGIPSQPACSGQLGGTVTESSGTSPATLSGSYAVSSSTCTKRSARE